MGGDKHRTFCAGKELKLSEDPLRTLKDFNLSDDAFLTVQKAPDQGSNTVVVRPSSNLNALETEIMRHFDALYQLLGLPEPQAARVCYPNPEGDKDFGLTDVSYRFGYF